MEKYTVEYKGKKYNYNGKNTGEVIEKFLNRRCFGEKIIFDARLVMFDADTMGDEWAKYETVGEDSQHIIIIERRNK